MSVVHTASGGGGGSVYAYAKIIYPAGSHCTCTQGSTVLTAPDTSGTCFFNLKGDGSYTIRTFDGPTWETSTNRREQAISVVRQYQIFIVTFSYD